MNNDNSATLGRPLRNTKDTLFRMIFVPKEELLSLSNAVNGTDYTDVDDLEVVTLDNAVYMNVKNDIAFIMYSYLSLYEHQSTFSPNLPLRNLFYVAREYEKLITKRSLYSSKLVKIPTPKFVVFYNGTKEQPDKIELRLSDAFIHSQSAPELELVVTMYNINLGHNEELMDRCPTLREYSIYVDKIRRYSNIMTVDEAINRAVDECIREGILADFLIKQRAEAINMSIFEYNEEIELELIRQDERELGIEHGINIGKEIGALKNLITLTIRKLMKGRSMLQAADELEVDVSELEPVYKAVQAAAPDYDVDKILATFEFTT